MAEKSTLTQLGIVNYEISTSKLYTFSEFSRKERFSLHITEINVQLSLGN